MPQIAEWIQADPFHKDDPRVTAESFMTSQGLISFCLDDGKGPLCYIRLDEDKQMVRIAIQFGPEAEVSKRRLIVGLINMGIPAMIKFTKDRGYKGLVFESVNPTLIKFGSNQGFSSVGHDDYALMFKENKDV